MNTVDLVILGIIVVGAILGMLLGFGKLLKFFTGGIVGIVISIVVVYFFLGVVSSWGFVQDLMAKMHEAMVNANNGFVDFLIKIGIEKVILAIILLVVVQIIRIFVVRVIKGIVEIDNPIMKAVNKFFGLVFMLAVLFCLMLIVFQIVHAVGGQSAENFRQAISGAFHLEWLFDNNPLNALFMRIGG